MPAEISVVIPTHDRPAGLARLLDALGRQTLDPQRYEVIVVDDGSSEPVEAGEPGAGGSAAPLRVVRHEQPRGPAAARNAGWRAAGAPIVAFIDDDCAPAEGWLEGVLGAADGDAVVIQGRVEPMPDQRHALHPLAHTIEVPELNNLFVSANIAYPRALLERLGGFDESFLRACGEDAELGVRAVAAGAEPRFAVDALVYHEVREMPLRDQLRHTTKWTDSVRVLAMHPELRPQLIGRVFWKPTHPWLLAAAAALVARKPRLAALALAPYVRHYRRVYGGDLAGMARALPSHLAIDACELGTVAAGSVRYRTLML